LAERSKADARRMSRQTFAFSVAVALAALRAPAAASRPDASSAANPIQAENALPGTSAWYVTQAPPPSVEGYTSESSVAPGDVVHLHVSTAPATRYRVEVYRLGWYGGAGGRLIGCVPGCSSDEPGVARVHPTPDGNGETV